LRTKIKENQIKELYVWDWDRLFRNRKKLKEFFQFCAMFKCNVHSYRQAFYESFYKIPAPFNEIMQNLFLDLLGWMAEDESIKKSMRVRASVRRSDTKPTMSYKGNKWGRKKLSTQKRNRIIELYQSEGKLSLRQIALQSGSSLGVVHKTLLEFKGGKSLKEPVNELSN